ncbi:hypothetical protein MNBD_GAMMA21-1794 [hydrothermal vent metagenome]|uniref:Inner membrane protein YgaP-like transmembrane domain-containing protein n=1 Tax=hydrothermal vent metagenome TaxID=652676 RepID=A0A3B1AAF8_9ZZZZ
MSAVRATMILASVMLWISFWLSDWNIHWLAYIPAAMLLVAGIVGFCPSTWLMGKIGFKPSKL